MMYLDRLPNQKIDEKTIFFLRRHWTTVLQIFSSMLILYIVPAGIAWYFYEEILIWLTDPFLGPLLAIVMGMYVMGVWLLTFVQFTNYYLDAWIVTNRRVINIEQNSLFNRTASELPLSVVQDVTSEVKGIVQTVLDFGNVYIQTAGEKDRFVFENIPHPEKIKEEVVRFVQEEKARVATQQIAQVVQAAAVNPPNKI